MSSHAARTASSTNRLVRSGESLLMRIAFASAGAAATAGVAGVIALVTW